MPITIAGSGTITGISAGGLPDGVITTDDIAADAVTNAKVNASAAIADSKLTGTTCKAFVNFNGTSTVAIRASYNVSSITDNGTGDYTVNFTTALADANYCVATTAMVIFDQSSSYQFGIRSTGTSVAATTKTSSALRLLSRRESDYDLIECNVSIFR
jgi:hypothetical protein